MMTEIQIVALAVLAGALVIVTILATIARRRYVRELHAAKTQNQNLDGLVRNMVIQVRIANELEEAQVLALLKEDRPVTKDAVLKLLDQKKVAV
jgi:hypothetical protein